MADHQAWIEVWPLQSIIPVNFRGTPGHLFYTSTRWLGNGYRFYMYNDYSGKSFSADEYVSPSNYSGDSAEAIAERPNVGGSYTNLANFNTLRFQGTSANGIGFDRWSSYGRGQAMQMVDSSGYKMATSSLGQGGSVTGTHLRCS